MTRAELLDLVGTAFHACDYPRRTKARERLLSFVLDEYQEPGTVEDWRGSTLDISARAIADVLLLALYRSDRETRERAADLFAQLCTLARDTRRAA